MPVGFAGKSSGGERSAENRVAESTSDAPRAEPARPVLDRVHSGDSGSRTRRSFRRGPAAFGSVGERRRAAGPDAVEFDVPRHDGFERVQDQEQGQTGRLELVADGRRSRRRGQSRRRRRRRRSGRPVYDHPTERRNRRDPLVVRYAVRPRNRRGTARVDRRPRPIRDLDKGRDEFCFVCTNVVDITDC